MAKKKSANTSSTEPRNAKLICVEIDQVNLYERNPRTTKNPEYTRIRQSIVRHGIEQPLIVTRRPDEDAYVVKAGGNTRLQILKELYATSSDPSYSMVNCIEVGWEDESAILLGHLRENILRGKLTFVDQAAAICALSAMIAEEKGESQLTIRDLQLALEQQGYPISSCSLSYMRYAADFLMSAMPVALSDGLGRRDVEKIRNLHRAGGEVWGIRGVGSSEEFDEVFCELCRRNDSPDWQLEPLQRAVEHEIAEATEINIQTIRMAIDAYQFGGAAMVEVDVSELEDELTDNDLAELTSDLDRAAANDDFIAPTVEVAVEFGAEAQESDGRSLSSARRSSVDPFVNLRRRAFGLADGLANRFGLGALVAPLPDCGNGFLITDVPNQATLDRTDTASRAAIGTMWWQLLAFSETACAPPELIAERVPEDSSLRQILEEQALELLFDRVDIIDPTTFAEQFWSRLSKEDWQDWMYLAHTHREIRHKVIETEYPLWRFSE